MKQRAPDVGMMCLFFSLSLYVFCGFFETFMEEREGTNGNKEEQVKLCTSSECWKKLWGNSTQTYKASLTENRSWEIGWKALPTLTLKRKTGRAKSPRNICCHLARATNRSYSTQTILSGYCRLGVSNNPIAVLALTPKENTGSAISRRFHLNVKCRQIYHANGFKVKPKAKTGLHLPAFLLALKLLVAGL